MTQVTNKIKRHTNYGVIIKQISIYDNKEAYDFLTTLVKVYNNHLISMYEDYRFISSFQFPKVFHRRYPR